MRISRFPNIVDDVTVRLIAAVVLVLALLAGATIAFLVSRDMDQASLAKAEVARSRFAANAAMEGRSTVEPARP